jgi:competence ComEA-like helix-hairpin-helix protein
MSQAAPVARARPAARPWRTWVQTPAPDWSWMASAGLVLLVLQLSLWWQFTWTLRNAPAPLRPEELRLRLDPNTATACELEWLPGIGPRRAAEIVAYRERVEPPAFRHIEDLDNVRGIGPATVEELRPWLVCPAAPATAEDAARR